LEGSDCRVTQLFKRESRWKDEKHLSSTGFLFSECWKTEKQSSRANKRLAGPYSVAGTMENIFPASIFVFQNAGRLKNILPEK
jgi:hypothetical protein